MHFILRATAGRQKGESSGSGRLGAISPGMLMNRGGGDIQADEDRLIWSTHQRVQQQTTADGCIIPLTWLSHAAQLALEVVIDVIDSPLHSNISHMLKLALPGNDYIYVVLDLMGSSNVSIKIAAINLLSLYLCDTDGQVDLKQIAQFEKVGGFHCMSELLSNFTSESTSGKHYGNNRRGVETSALVVQDLLEALLSLLFWRKRRKYDSSAVSSGAQLQPAMRVSVPPTDVNIAKSGSIQPNLTAYEKNSKLMTMGYGYGKFRRDVDCADEVINGARMTIIKTFFLSNNIIEQLDSVGTSETGTTATTANIGPPGFHRNTSIDIEDDALGDKPQIGHVRSFGGSIGESPLNSEKTHRFTPVSIIAPRDNFSSVDGFNSIGESILQGNNANLLPMFGPSGQLEVKPTIDQCIYIWMSNTSRLHLGYR